MRISMVPPLWAPSAPINPSPSDPGAYTVVKDTIGDQSSQISKPGGTMEWPATSHTACPGEAAKACANTSGCVCFSCYTQPANMQLAMFQLHRDDQPISNKMDWTYYHLPPPPTPPGPPPSPAWSQTLDLATGSIRIHSAVSGCGHNQLSAAAYLFSVPAVCVALTKHRAPTIAVSA